MQHLTALPHLAIPTPLSEAVVIHIMRMKQLIVQSIEDSTKSINDCLEVGIEPNEQIPSNLPKASSSTVDE